MTLPSGSRPSSAATSFLRPRNHFDIIPVLCPNIKAATTQLLAPNMFKQMPLRVTPKLFDLGPTNRLCGFKHGMWASYDELPIMTGSDVVLCLIQLICKTWGCRVIFKLQDREDYNGTACPDVWSRWKGST
jgi:hypothetical protein